MWFSISLLLCVCQRTWLGKLGVCSTEGKWTGRCTEYHEVNEGDNVKEVSRLWESPMWYIAFQASKGVFPWKHEVG